MTTELPSLAKVQYTGNLIKYGVGDSHADFSTISSDLDEDEKLRLKDLQTADILFNQHKMTFDLKKGGFDLGIGGLGLSDSLFFNDMRIPYIKLLNRDIEAHTMQRWLRMPVLSSSYPNQEVWANYEYGELSDLSGYSGLKYKFESYWSSLVDKLEVRDQLKAFRKKLGVLKSHLLDEMDQDNGLILGYGTGAALF